MVEENFLSDPEPFLATLARLFATEGSAREVAILANSVGSIRETSYDNWNGGTYGYSLFLQLPNWLYNQAFSEIENSEKAILEKGALLFRGYENDFLEHVFISPSITGDKDWRNKAKAWLTGDGVSNQGRVRSDNIPSRTADGLLFRSQPEIFLYKALKSADISFAPLPVFVRGGRNYQRIEPDFFIVKEGIAMVVEVDGDTVHHETPAEAHARISMLYHEGVHIERVRASECNTQELANEFAKKILQVFERIKASR